MKALRTHVCLVSDQPTPNLVPLLDQALKPEAVVLVVSPGMQQRARHLREILQVRQIQVSEWPLASPWRFDEIQLSMLELLEEHRAQRDEKTIGLNVTGGTKVMSIAAYEAFRTSGLPIFYVHPERDQINWLYPHDQPPHELADRVNISTFLQAHGARVESLENNAPRPFLEVGEQLVMAIERYSKALGTLNWLASTADHNLKTPPLSQDHGDLKTLIDLFEQRGFLRRQKNHLRFKDENARFFANGGWLEYLVFDAVRRLRGQDAHIQDFARSINIEREVTGKTVKNELDVVFLRNNRLHVIECKTARFRGGREDSKAADALYKLDTLTDLAGGLQARGMLVSFQDLDNPHRTRAADLGIAICAGHQLRNLQEHLRQFITGKR